MELYTVEKDDLEFQPYGDCVYVIHEGEKRIFAIEKVLARPSINIPTGLKMEVFKIDMYDENGIQKTWDRVNRMEEAGLLKRSYEFDYEKIIQMDVQKYTFQ